MTVTRFTTGHGLYAVQVGEWGLTQAQAKKLRDYLLRGGFFMADDCHGTQEQAYFENTMKMVFPDRELVDIPNDDPIFYTFFDVDDRFQIPGAEHLATGHKKDGYVAHWKGTCFGCLCSFNSTHISAKL